MGLRAGGLIDLFEYWKGAHPAAQRRIEAVGSGRFGALKCYTAILEFHPACRGRAKAI